MMFNEGVPLLHLHHQLDKMLYLICIFIHIYTCSNYNIIILLMFLFFFTLSNVSIVTPKLKSVHKGCVCVFLHDECV